MIQRIQSVYFFLAAIFVAVTCVLPTLNQNGIATTVLDNTPLLILVSCAAALFLIAIFLFKSRPLQTNVTRLALFIALITIAAILYYENADGDFNIQYGAFAPLVGMAMGLLGMRAVARDEKLVRSQDRLR